MKTIQRIFLAILFLGVVSVLVCINTEKDAVSAIDNRKLARWKGDIEPYFKDRLGFRDKMINFYTVYNDRLLGEMVHPFYEYGKDGYIFRKVEKEVYDEEFLDFFCRYLRQIQDYCEQRGAKFIYERNPSKPSVYTRYLPAGYKYKAYFYTYMSEKLDEYGVRYVDNVKYLREKSKTVQVFDKKYDAGHWNAWGTFYGTNNLLAEIAKDYPTVQKHELFDFEIDTIVQKTLGVSFFAINEKVPAFKLRSDSAQWVHAYQGIEINREHPAFAAYQIDNIQLPDVLFFQSSYYNKDDGNKFYRDRFRHVVIVHCYQNILNFDYYFNLVKPNYVVLETGEYAVEPYYFDKEKLRTKVLNKPYDSVMNKVHERYVVKDLKAYQKEDKEALLTISFAVPDSVAFGYLFVGKEEYDLQVNGDRAEVTLKKTDYDEKQASVALFH